MAWSPLPVVRSTDTLPFRDFFIGSAVKS